MKNNNYIYVVTAYRWASRSKHSYIVLVSNKKHEAKKAATKETESRGGKYDCEVLEFDLKDKTHKKLFFKQN